MLTSIQVGENFSRLHHSTTISGFIVPLFFECKQNQCIISSLTGRIFSLPQRCTELKAIIVLSKQPAHLAYAIALQVNAAVVSFRVNFPSECPQVTSPKAFFAMVTQRSSCVCVIWPERTHYCMYAAGKLCI